jgi:DnaJ-class molecular chaperone
MFEQQALRELGVAPGAPEPEIKAAYRRLVLQFHPDRSVQGHAQQQGDTHHHHHLAWPTLCDDGACTQL